MVSISGSHGGHCREKVAVRSLERELVEAYKGTDLGAKLEGVALSGLDENVERMYSSKVSEEYRK